MSKINRLDRFKNLLKIAAKATLKVLQELNWSGGKINSIKGSNFKLVINILKINLFLIEET